MIWGEVRGVSMGEQLEVVTRNDLALDTGLWEETDGAPEHPIIHPFTPMTVVRPGILDAEDRSPIIEGPARSLAFP
jgi:hypothetical protein